MKISYQIAQIKHGGFALVVTIPLLALLVLIALAMLSLGTVELRASSSTRAKDEARANARMALMLALGELQKEAGPDQRITASAAIMDTDEATESPDGVNQPNYVGVWESWDTWLTDPKDGITIQDTYQRGRHPALFRKWLVSHPDHAWKSKRNSATKGTLSPKPILMVGAGSLGKNGNPTDYVRASKVPTPTGSYAYWVGDESQKASIDLFTDTADLAGDFQLNQLRSSQIHHQGAGRLDDLAGLDLPIDEAAKLITLKTGENTGVDRDDLRKQFHSLTTGTWSVLSDTRGSGLKRDLSLLFEADSLPSEMQTTSLFNGVTFDTPIRPMVGEVGKITPQNPFVAPVSWRQMREYYRLYRSFETIKTPAETLTWSGGKPFTHRYMVGAKDHAHIMTTPDSAGYLRQPVLLRQTWVLATRTAEEAKVNGVKTYSCYIVAVPVFFLWNPYNLEMKTGSRELTYVASLDLAANMRYRLYRKDVLVADKDFTVGSENYSTYNTYMARPVAPDGGEISFKPGEVIAFTLDVAGSAQEFDANYGYRPLANTVATRGLQLRLMSLGNVPATEAPSIALRFQATAKRGDNFWWGNSSSAMTVGIYQHNLGKFGAYDESGKLVVGTGHNATVIGTRSIDWMTSEEDNTAIVQDDPAHRAEWDFSTRAPQPFAIISLTAKDTDPYDYDGATGGYAADFRNRTWLHSTPTNINQYLMNPTDLNRADSAYQIYFKAVNGDQEVSQYIQVNGKNSYYGGGFGPATGQTMAPVYELPTSPAISLADFATMDMTHAHARTLQSQHSGTPAPPTYPMYNLKHASRIGGSFGVGIGNGYAHPMIAADKVYQRNSFGIDNGHPIQGNGAGTKIAAFDDFWDHLFLTNEALWDSYYLSSMLTDSSRGGDADNLDSNLDAFFDNGTGFKPLSNRLLRPYVSEGAHDPASILKESDAWKKSAAFVMSRAPFNVNSTSLEAWKALLWSLQDREISVMDASSGQISLVKPADDEVLLSRFRLANSSQEGGDSAADPAAWQGIRKLKKAEINRLAEEIVKQVKLRGPFLNMAEFVNRRLSNDRFGVTGALQAAIDWDEFDSGYSGVGSSSLDSINRGFKQPGDMIKSPPVTYPYPMAARGSRYAGIPGYVMQSDLLQALGNTLTPRGDTFRIRSYGEAKDANGNVIAKAWCEAIVQRRPEYVDPSDDPWQPSKLPDGNVNSAISEVNQKFGRRFHIQSFRELRADEI